MRLEVDKRFLHFILKLLRLRLSQLLPIILFSACIPFNKIFNYPDLQPSPEVWNLLLCFLSCDLMIPIYLPINALLVKVIDSLKNLILWHSWTKNHLYLFFRYQVLSNGRWDKSPSRTFLRNFPWSIQDIKINNSSIKTLRGHS